MRPETWFVSTSVLIFGRSISYEPIADFGEIENIKMQIKKNPVFEMIVLFCTMESNVA